MTSRAIELIYSQTIIRFIRDDLTLHNWRFACCVKILNWGPQYVVGERWVADTGYQILLYLCKSTIFLMALSLMCFCLLINADSHVS
jgi:hypothetical protein